MLPASADAGSDSFPGGLVDRLRNATPGTAATKRVPVAAMSVENEDRGPVRGSVAHELDDNEPQGLGADGERAGEAGVLTARTDGQHRRQPGRWAPVVDPLGDPPPR